MAVAGAGFLSIVSTKARLYCNEPGASSVFSDTDILTFIRRAYADIFSDMNRVHAFKPRARVDITVVGDQRIYALPPHVAQFLELKKLDGNGNFLWEQKPRHPLHPWGPGFTIEGPVIRFDPVWREGETMQLVFTPSGECPIFELSVMNATNDKINVAGTEVIVDETIIAGSLSTRANSYIGYTFHAISGALFNNFEQECMVTGFDNTTKTLTIAPALSYSNDESGTIEVTPNFAYRWEDLIALKVARFLMSISGDFDRAKQLHGEYQDGMRSFRIEGSNAQARTGVKFNRVVRGRSRLGKTR